jgi:hypothetical protein
MKKIIKSLLVLILIVFFGSSCLDQVDVELRDVSQKLVVEGLFSNIEEENFLKLAYTLPVGTLKRTEPVQGAFVELRASNGEKMIYRPATDAVGIYRPIEEPIVAKEGIEYSIYIRLSNGKEFSSIPEKLLKEVPIQTINARFRRETPIGYQILVDFQDPKESENYYRWETLGYQVKLSTGKEFSCCARCYVPSKSENINILSDNGLNGNSVRLRPVYFSQAYTIGKHYIEAKQFAISRNAFQYWTKYSNQIQREGTIFDPLPAPVIGNVSNINDQNELALGFFEIATISKAKLVVPGDTLGEFAVAFIINNSNMPSGDCMLAYPFSMYADKPPKGW